MAKLQLSVIASGISGKHSGGVFLKGNGGINIRRKVRPMQTASDYQANVKSHLTYVQSLWATLTSAQVKAWNLLAKTVKVSNVLAINQHYLALLYFRDSIIIYPVLALFAYLTLRLW